METDPETDFAEGSVVAGIDGSPSSFEALRWAAQVARCKRAPLHVAHVLPSPGVYLSEAAVLIQAQFTEKLESDSVSLLRRARELVGAEFSDVDSTFAQYPGPPSAALVELSGRAGLLVLGATGAGTVGAMLVGSTGQRVANHARCPVLVCRGGGPVEADERPIVVGVDGSALSIQAVGIAHEYAAVLGARLVAVHAWGPARTIQRYGAFRLVDWPAVEAEERALLAESMAGHSAAWPDVRVETVLEQNSAGRTLLEYAGQARFVVVGSRGRSRIAGALLGSTSQNLLHHSPCPVMICRGKGAAGVDGEFDGEAWTSDSV
ncbi:nucleotide-binding universal stress UspA family protein [Rhodococcus sp. OK519]|uniref:universal stress protein n=1 Tax=Rhodococcus sp. OK519 TaxID=2135729 RepID=UPI000D38CB2B|nr:nucleotide-binding universal stress UspA family protein [Rhodococcus sp. OK519]